MKKKRLIPVLLLRNGVLVQSKGFKRYQTLGNPSSAVKRLSEWAADELIYLDISREDSYDLGRDDLGHANRTCLDDIIDDIAHVSFMPITLGGRIRSLEHIAHRLQIGADKVTLNTLALDRPEMIELAAREFGSQCIVVSMDVVLCDGKLQVVADGGRRLTGLDPAAWAREVEARGAGEILVNSIDRDGMKQGYDLDLLNVVCRAVNLPVIALGGVGEWSHFDEALSQTGVDAIAAANVFHYTDQSVYLARKHLFEKGFNVRSPDLLSVKIGDKE